MSESAQVDLDRATTQAWREYRSELADRLAGLELHEPLVIEVESAFDEPADGCAPYVQFWRDDTDRLVGEVSGNGYLHSAHRLDKQARRRLSEMGWSKPKAKREEINFRATSDLAHADQLAAIAVLALREVFGVRHPAFLAGEAETSQPEVGYGAGCCVIDEPIATMPDDREHLETMIDRSLVAVIGHTPVRDDDGNIPVASGTAVVFVRSMRRKPIIRIWSAVVIGVTDAERARFEVEVLNRDRPLVKFRLVEDYIVADVHLPAAPFVSEHLTETLAMMCKLADDVDDDLAVRVGGRRFIEPGDVGDAETDGGDTEGESDIGDHPAMMTLAQLEAESPRSVTPAMAAQICGSDIGLLLALITHNEEQEIAWRSARDDARLSDPGGEEADVCDIERKHAKRTVKLLRQALRYVVEQP